MQLGFAPDATINLTDQCGVRDFGSIGHHSVPAEGVEDEPRHRAAARPVERGSVAVAGPVAVWRFSTPV